MAGKSREALEAARQLRALMSEDLLRAAPGYDWYAAQGYAVQMRFQQWPALLAEREPSAELPGLHTGYLHARASALAATGKWRRRAACWRNSKPRWRTYRRTMARVSIDSSM
ncbi:MAG: hypothetical protein IPG43_01800 [Proteobacteria bacterium]|nr:hypothetical protein [Pseudomonadota bacterium]